MTALDKLQDKGIDTENKKEVKKAKIDDIPVLEWVQNETTKQLKKYVAIEREFERLELSFSDDELLEIKQNIASIMDSYGDMLAKNGIGEQSIKDVITSNYKNDLIMRKYYGIGGLKSVTEQQLKDYYIDNYARIKYIKVDLKDGSGNLLEGNDKEDRIKMAEEYLQRLKDGESIDDLIDEYSEFTESLASEAAAATATGENGETLETTTVTTTSVTTTEITDTSEEVTKTDENSNEETDEDETSVTTIESSDDEDTNNSEETTTTNPYKNEAIVRKVTTAEQSDEDESDETTTLNYSPSKKSNEAIFGDAIIGKPFLVQEDDACYIILKLDIEERMTNDDLWSEQMKDSIMYNLYYDEYDEMIDEIADKYEVVKNEAAYDRYNPQKYEFDFGNY
jgi:hypothetical protein